MKRYFGILILLSVMLLPLLLLAQVYYWVDEKGIKHYSDTAPANRKGLKDFKVIDSSPDSQEPDQETTEASPNAPIPATPQKKAMPKVTIYTTSWCPACKAAKQWLGQNKVPYQEFDIETSTENHDRYLEAGSSGKIPFIVVGKNKMTGFDEDLMRNWLGMNP